MTSQKIQDLFNEALDHHQAGRLEAADKLYLQILSIEPNHADSLHLRGVIGHTIGQLDAAQALIQQAIRLKNNVPAYYNNLGNVLKDQRKLPEAIECYRYAIRLNPNYAEAHYNLGYALENRGNLEEAFSHYKDAVKLQPKLAEAHNNLGNISKKLGQLPEAKSHYRHALAANPDLPDAHYNMGLLLKDENKTKEAETFFRHAIALKPAYVEAHNNLGVLLLEQGQHDDAMLHFQKAIAIKPDHAESHVNEAMTLLLKGDMAEGWRKYEWRWKMGSVTAPKTNKPVWDGGNLQGKTILLFGEQGLGDNLQFIRYASMLKNRGGKILLACPPALRRLFKQTGIVDHILTENTREPDYDCYASLMSLPMLLGTTLETIPNSVPYLLPSPDDVAIWAKRLANETDLKVGLVWAGSSRRDHPNCHAVDQRRSMSLAQFAALGSIPGVKFFSLQKDVSVGHLDNLPAGLTVIDYMNHVRDFADTAAFVANLDLIIGVDTSVIHLAGAMGKPVWVLSRFDGCWRWLLDREDSPWYPTLSIFRQPIIGDWQSVIENVRVRLSSFAHQRSRS